MWPAGGVRRVSRRDGRTKSQQCGTDSVHTDERNRREGYGGKRRGGRRRLPSPRRAGGERPWRPATHRAATPRLLLLPPAAQKQRLPPEKQTAQKMMTAMSTRMSTTISFIFMFCHHMRLRSCRPVLWNLSACGQARRGVGGKAGGGWRGWRQQARGNEDAGAHPQALEQVLDRRSTLLRAAACQPPSWPPTQCRS